MSGESISEMMKVFWDEKARENALYYISSFRAYDDQDPDEFWIWGKKLTDRFLEESRIAFTGKEAVLEIGCGIGRMTRYFAERFQRVVGVDVSSEMIGQARENLATLHNVELRVGTGYDLRGCDDALFQFVFSYLTFQHIPDVKIVMNYVS
jgi:ubiquinone/menaquinone biosynthesis C-methylase UbiE